MKDSAPTSKTPSSVFWQHNQVGGPYTTLSASEDALLARARAYPRLYELMPCTVRSPSDVVLDYGCGPGHDTLMYLRGGARLVHYADVSARALSTTRHRLILHGYQGRAIGCLAYDLKGEALRIPRADIIHCAGVLHHCTYPADVLQQLRAACKPGGLLRLMVYDGARSPHTQSGVPITHWWDEDEVADMCAMAGWAACTYRGSYPCPAPWRPGCLAACYEVLP